MYTNEAIATFRPSDDLWLGYAYYAFPIFLVQNAAENIYGAKLLNQELIRTARVIVPPPAEQRSIASFLDRETAKIDALIAEQQRLIELLKEKRQAVISSAVLRRVDERTTKLRHLIEVTPGFAFPSDGFSEYGEGHRLLRGVNVGVGVCRWDETVYWAREVDARVNEYRLEVGDLVLGMDRPWISEGTRIAQIQPSDLPALCVQRVARIRAKAGSFLEYIRIVLASQAFQAYLEADLTGVSVPHISERQILGFPVRALSFDDQVSIAADTMSSTSVIDNLIAESKRSISLLQERRTALISAAVTGKIDVRGVADRAA
jgi:type I restriction enzyme S subunit